MPGVGGAQGGVGGVQLADGSILTGGSGFVAGGFPAVDTVSVASASRLVDVDVSSITTVTEGFIWVNSVGALYRLERNGAGLPTGSTFYAAVLGEANSRWVRCQIENLRWQNETAWFIDPSNTTTLASNENDGLTATTPLLSTSEYRARNFGVVYTAARTVNFLSASAVVDDGNFCGINGNPGVILTLQGTPVKIGATGTFDAAVTPIAGNGRYLVTDTSENWTTNTWVSTATNPRLIRDVAKTKHAFVLTDQGAGVASLSQPTDASETAGFSNANVNFVNGESFEVCSIPTLPTIQYDGAGGITIVLRCIKLTNSPAAPGGTLFGVLAGFVPASAMAWTMDGTTPAFFNCFFGGVQSFFNIPIFRTCVAWGANLQFYQSIDNTTNQLQLQNSTIVANGCGGSIGLLNSWDTTGIVVSARHGASMKIEGLVGTGNTGKLIDAVTSVVYGGATATAATTDVAPFRVNGVSSAILPMFDGVVGGAIYT